MKFAIVDILNLFYQEKKIIREISFYLQTFENKYCFTKIVLGEKNYDCPPSTSILEGFHPPRLQRVGGRGAFLIQVFLLHI